MYRTITASIAAGQQYTPPTYVPGKLVGVAFTLDTATFVKLYAQLTPALQPEVFDRYIWADSVAIGQAYVPLNAETGGIVGGMAYLWRFFAPQVATQSVLFVYEESPGIRTT